MEKNVILAFALSLIVLIGWSFFFGPQKDQGAKKEEVVGQEAPKKISEGLDAKGLTRRDLSPSITSPAPQTRVSEQVAKADEQEIEVDTPLYRAVFSNAGPTLKSFKLKNYYESTNPNSDLIELVSLEEGMGDSLLFRFDSQSLAQRKNIIYEVDEKALRLGTESPPKDLVFRTVTPEGFSIDQIFRFYPDEYRIDLKIEVFNQSGLPDKGAFTAHLMALPPKEKTSYYSYVGLVLLLDDKLEEVKIKNASEEKIVRGQVDWMAYEDDFFITAIIPEEVSKGIFTGRLLSSGVLEGFFQPAAISLGPSQKVSSRYTLYLGPRDLGIMKQLGKGLDRAVNFGWTDIIAKPLLYMLRFFNQYIKNYGVSIILLTILIKILFWPLTHKSYKSMGEMKKLQPRMAKMKEKYKDNKEQMNKEMMALYKTYKVNPMGGCLPMVIQIPVFFALFRILGNAIELRHAPFMLWINDLSAPDRLFNFPFQIPYMAPPSGIPVLTLLMGASMFLQQKMTPTPGDPTQAKIMMFLPIIFTFMFINFPSGLVLYWFINNILSIGQQYRIQKKSA
ncbi:MAG: membrane protein insertase YidC [Desulfobacteraceae bacterium]|nr:membrane protein insertase YidC [Desulfobacteraceae bacterium]